MSSKTGGEENLNDLIKKIHKDADIQLKEAKAQEKKSQGGYFSKDDTKKQRSVTKSAVINQKAQQIRKQEAEETKNEHESTSLDTPTASEKNIDNPKENFIIKGGFEKSYEIINNHIDKFVNKLQNRTPSKDEIEDFMVEILNIHPEVTIDKKAAYSRHHYPEGKPLPSQFEQDVQAVQKDLKIPNLEGKDQVVSMACKALKSVGFGKFSDLLMEKAMSPKGKEAIEAVASQNKNMLKEQARAIGDKMKLMLPTKHGERGVRISQPSKASPENSR